MKAWVIQFTALCLLMLVTGLFWGTWFAMTRSIHEFSAAEFIHIGKVIIQNVGNYMPVIFPACIVFMMIAVWRYPRANTGGFYSALIALLLIVAALLITLGIEVPIDNQIKQWTESTVPIDWEDIRRRWDLFHTTRTLLSLFSFVFFSLAVFMHREKQRAG